MVKRNQQLDDIAEGVNCVAELIVQLGCEGETINDKLDKLIEVLLAGPSMLSSEQRVALRNLLQDEAEHHHG